MATSTARHWPTTSGSRPSAALPRTSARSTASKTSESDQSDDRQALLEIHATERRAHLEGDAALIASVFADEVWEAGRGQLRRESRVDAEERFRKYFSTVRYSVWDDLQPPHVWVSADGLSGWMAIHIEGRLVTTDEAPQQEVVFESAWIAVYEKRDGAWQMVGVSSSVVERG